MASVATFRASPIRSWSPISPRPSSGGRWAPWTSTNDALTSGRLLERVRTDRLHRDAIAAADIITLQIGRNDWFETCMAPDMATCLPAGERTVEANLDAILGEIVSLRAGRPTAIRVLDYYAAEIGDPALPGDWGFDDTQEATAAFLAAYLPLLRQLDATICRVAETHGAVCVDLVGAFNGADGTGDPSGLLRADHTHLNEEGMTLVARLVADAGWATLG